MRLIRFAAAAAFLAVAIAPRTQADTLKINDAVSNTVNISYGSWTSVGGGSFDVSYLDTGSGDVALDFLYCVDLNNTISIPGTYALTTTTTTGVVNGSAVSNAAEVAWLLEKYAGIADIDKQTALQVVIWETIYDNTYDLANGNFKLGGGNTAGFTAALSWLETSISGFGGIGSGTVANYTWISPKNDATTVRQGLVTGESGGSSVVPEAGSLALLLPGLAPLGLALRRRRAR